MNDTSAIAKQLGSRGGKATLNKYGKSHFKKLSEMAVKVKQEKAAAKRNSAS